MAQFRSFDSIADMVDYMQKQTEWANANLAPKQQAVTYGDHWARFDQKGFVIFGKVATLDEATGSTPSSEKDYELKSLTANHDRGYMFGKCYSVIEPTGEWGDTHRANLWPIPVEMFDAVKAVGWDTDALEVDMLTALWVHHRAWWNHVKSLA